MTTERRNAPARLVHYYDANSDTAIPASVSQPFPIQDPWSLHAERVVFTTYGDRVSVETKGKNLTKFGTTTNTVTDTKVTVMTLPDAVNNETYVGANSITTVSSSNSNDTMQLTVEGHTISGTDLTFVVQNITLTGTTQASLDTPLARVTRVYNNSGTAIQGAVYVYEDDTNNSTPGVPDTDAGVHMIIPAGLQQSEKAASAISSVDYYLISHIRASLGRTNNATCDVRLEARQLGKVFRPLGAPIRLRATVTISAQIDYRPYLIVPKNSDVRLVATASANDTEVTGEIHGLLAGVLS